MNITLTPKLKFILAITAITALLRLLPHEFNFSPIGAIALFAGTYITNKRLAIILPLTILFFSDVLLELFYGNGFYSDMGFVYGAFTLVACLGFFLRKHQNIHTIIATSLFASVIFFVITNFGTWAMMDIYSKTGAGLMNCYAAGLPFFRGTVMGDLFYNIVFFSVYAIAKWRYPVLQKG